MIDLDYTMDYKTVVDAQTCMNKFLSQAKVVFNIVYERTGLRRSYGLETVKAWRTAESTWVKFSYWDGWWREQRANKECIFPFDWLNLSTKELEAIGAAEFERERKEAYAAAEDAENARKREWNKKQKRKYKKLKQKLENYDEEV